jgi:predicted DNA-binding transcriptional regulator YafY
MANRKNAIIPKPAIRILHFIQILASADMVSKEEIKEKLSIQNSAFYKHLAEIRELFPIECIGGIGGSAYYQINKNDVAKYFNIKIKAK